MSKKYRLILSITAFVILFLCGLFIDKNIQNILGDFCIVSGLLMLILLSLVDQPFFSKDSNIFVNAITAFLALLTVKQDQRNDIYYLLWSLALYLIIASLVVMWKRNKTLDDEAKGIQLLSRINRNIGKPESLFSMFFVWGLFTEYGFNSVISIVLLVFWGLFMILTIPAVSTTIESFFEKGNISSNNPVGKIFGVQSKNTFLVKLLSNREYVLHRFDYVTFYYSVDQKKHNGIILDVYLLDQEQWIKVLTTKELDQLCSDSDSNDVPDLVYKIDKPDDNQFLQSFVGLVSENSMIDKINFVYNSKIDIEDGQLLEIRCGTHRVLYQVVQGITKNEQLENKNQSSYIIGEAIQLGEWNKDRGCFEQYGWVPENNTPVFLSSNIEQPEVYSNEMVIGSIPNTNYPVILNKEYAVTHHTAVLGITGSGKSVFVRNLVKNIANEDTKVIVVDLSGEYREKLDNLTSIISDNESRIIKENIENLAIENAKYPNQRKTELIAQYEHAIKECFLVSLNRFFESDETMGLFEITEIVNNASTLDYTKWFFFVLFNCAKLNQTCGKRVCVVLEEAHTVIPEMSTMGIQDTASKATINSISQIALQGRKYNIGFIVVAQRTANVSKTVLTQCNSVIVFKELDKTTSDFLSNYMGRHMIEMLPNLRMRTAIAMGKAFRSSSPMIFEVPEINENKDEQDE